MTNRVLWMQAATGDEALVDEYGAIDDRQLLGMVFNQAGVGNATGTDLKVSQRGAGANFSVDVAAGIAVVRGGDVTGQGFYVIQSDAVQNVVVPDPPASGDRIHRVVAQVRDKLHNSTDWTTYDWVPLVLEDTGSGKPALPDSAIDLGEIYVAAAQTSVTDGDINDMRRAAVSTIGLGRYVSSDAGRPFVPWGGEMIWRTDKDDYEAFDGNDWRQFGLNPPYAILRRSGNTSISTSTTTALGFDTETADSHGGHDNVTNNSRYTAPQSGVYAVSGVVPWANSTADGKYEMSFRVNGGTIWAGGYCWKGSDNVTPVLHGSALLELTQGDYVEMLIWQGTGGSQSVDASFSQGPRFEIEWRRSL